MMKTVGATTTLTNADASGFYKHLDPEERPTFHEIRALGADLYIDMGWSETEVQSLLGHTSLK